MNRFHNEELQNLYSSQITTRIISRRNEKYIEIYKLNGSSSPARTVGSWVRIPLEAWMSVCIYFVFVLSCVYVVASRQADPSSEESCRLNIGLGN
jgi:hypothetical protein